MWFLFWSMRMQCRSRASQLAFLKRQHDGYRITFRSHSFVDPAQTGTNNEEQPRGGIVKNIEQNEKWSWNCVESNIKSNICFSGRSSQRYKLLTAFGHLKKKVSDKILRRHSKLMKEFRKNEVWSLIQEQKNKTNASVKPELPTGLSNKRLQQTLPHPRS